ncbi:MAG: hypothetical protein ACOCRL_02495 [Bacillota bacterium]
MKQALIVFVGKDEYFLFVFDYYALNIALIKREYIGEGFEIVSELESFSLNDK